MVVLFLVFLVTFTLFFIAAAPFYLPTNSVQVLQFSTFFFPAVVILTGVSWYLTVVLACISLMSTFFYVCGKIQKNLNVH